MIAKPEWFQRRKYAGWGAYPRTWQGWLYIAIALVIIGLIQIIPIDMKFKISLTSLVALVLVIDVISIMLKLPKDERDKKHEAIAERNALWAIIIVLAIGVAYEIASNAVQQKIYVDPFVIAALIIGLIVKAISNFYLDRKD